MPLSDRTIAKVASLAGQVLRARDPRGFLTNRQIRQLAAAALNNAPDRPGPESTREPDPGPNPTEP